MQNEAQHNFKPVPQQLQDNQRTNAKSVDPPVKRGHKGGAQTSQQLQPVAQKALVLEDPKVGQNVENQKQSMQKQQLKSKMKEKQQLI